MNNPGFDVGHMHTMLTPDNALAGAPVARGCGATYRRRLREHPWSMVNRFYPPSDVWIDERLVVRESPIEGRGLFFTGRISAGTVVIRLGGHLVSSAELESLILTASTDPASPYVDTITVFDNSHLVLPVGTSIHFGNHSCNPTLWHVGAFEIATRREVRADDEATLDYGTISGAEAFSMLCRCATAACRGEVTSADWSRPELQQRYRGHWVPALQERIDGA